MYGFEFKQRRPMNNVYWKIKLNKFLDISIGFEKPKMKVEQFF